MKKQYKNIRSVTLWAVASPILVISITEIQRIFGHVQPMWVDEFIFFLKNIMWPLYIIFAGATGSFAGATGSFDWDNYQVWLVLFYTVLGNLLIYWFAAFFIWSLIWCLSKIKSPSEE